MTVIPVNDVLPNPDQPRTIFDEEELRGLAQSISETGLIQPIVVEKAGDRYVLVDGERRLRACKLLKLEKIEAVVREGSNHKGQERLTAALVANVQRSQMGWVDEAKAYATLLDQLGTVELVAEKTGMSASVIYGRLALLDLAPLAQKFFNLKKIPFDLSLIAMFKRMNVADQESLASQAVTRGMRTTSIIRAGQKMMKDHGKKYEPAKRQAKVIKVDGHFNATSMVAGKLPAAVKRTAIATCEVCPVYAEASLQTCNKCPLPYFLRRLPQTKAN
jgi:ParB family transcriptional regulator, chromosome partitioning protein